MNAGVSESVTSEIWKLNGESATSEFVEGAVSIRRVLRALTLLHQSLILRHQFPSQPGSDARVGRIWSARSRHCSIDFSRLSRNASHGSQPVHVFFEFLAQGIVQLVVQVIGKFGEHFLAAPLPRVAAVPADRSRMFRAAVAALLWLSAWRVPFAQRAAPGAVARESFPARRPGDFGDVRSPKVPPYRAARG